MLAKFRKGGHVVYLIEGSLLFEGFHRIILYIRTDNFDMSGANYLSPGINLKNEAKINIVMNMEQNPKKLEFIFWTGEMLLCVKQQHGF